MESPCASFLYLPYFLTLRIFAALREIYLLKLIRADGIVIAD